MVDWSPSNGRPRRILLTSCLASLLCFNPLTLYFLVLLDLSLSLCQLHSPVIPSHKFCSPALLLVFLLFYCPHRFASELLKLCLFFSFTHTLFFLITSLCWKAGIQGGVRRHTRMTKIKQNTGKLGWFLPRVDRLSFPLCLLIVSWLILTGVIYE